MNNQRICAIAIAVFFISLYSLFSIGHYGGDGYEDYLTARSIVLNHDLAFDADFNIKDQLDYKKDAGIKGSDGRTYSSRGGLVIPVILSFFYYLGHIIARFFKDIPHDFITMFFVSFSNPLISAMNCLFVFLISMNLYFSLRTSVILSMVYGLATMAPVYIRTGFAEPCMTLFMLIAFYFVLKYKNCSGRRYLALAAAAIGLAVLTKSTAMIFLPAFIFYICYVVFKNGKEDANRVKDTAVFLIPLAVFLALTGIYNNAIYGSFFKFGGRDVLNVTTRVASAPHFFKGLYYYLLSTGKGFFLFNLPLIAALASIRAFSVKRRPEAFFLTLFFICNLLFFAMSFRRGSLFSWGPRYLYPSIPMLIFLIGGFYESNKNFIQRLAVGFLYTAGFLVMMPCMFINQSKFYLFVKEKLILPEYMINFIPDLSPISGAWKMFISNVAGRFFDKEPLFLYNPDYVFINPVRASMEGYNNFDFWFTKIMAFNPSIAPQAFFICAILSVLSIASLFLIVMLGVSDSGNR